MRRKRVLILILLAIIFGISAYLFVSQWLAFFAFLCFGIASLNSKTN